MKSSVFYKTYLKDNENDGNGIDNEKKEEIMVTNTNDMNENDSDGFEIISGKINATKYDESEETSSTDYEQIEGGNDEFTEIFGEEDMDIDSDNNYTIN